MIHEWTRLRVNNAKRQRNESGILYNEFKEQLYTCDDDLCGVCKGTVAKLHRLKHWIVCNHKLTFSGHVRNDAECVRLVSIVNIGLGEGSVSDRDLLRQGR